MQQDVATNQETHIHITLFGCKPFIKPIDYDVPASVCTNNNILFTLPPLLKKTFVLNTVKIPGQLSTKKFAIEKCGHKRNPNLINGREFSENKIEFLES